MKNLILCLFLLFIAACNSPIPTPPIPVPVPIPTPIPVPIPVPVPTLKYSTGFNYKPGQKGLTPGLKFAVPALTLELPKKFSWAQMFPVAIRDQGSCGSCWAFASTGVLDFAVKIYGGKEMLLSEQMTTNEGGYYGCGGGLFAVDVLKRGLVLDSACPYHADGRACPGHPTNYAAKALDAFNLGDENSAPATALIKQAILQYGAVACDVAADSDWNQPSEVMTGKDDGLNHLIIVTGWDDNLGAWEMRNSWGSSWGNHQGYNWVAYGAYSICHDVGVVAYSPVPAYTRLPK